VLGCHGTDAELASLFADWKMQREMGREYPTEQEVIDLARSHGAML
jgi:hypothetical protein